LQDLANFNTKASFSSLSIHRFFVVVHPALFRFAEVDGGNIFPIKTGLKQSPFLSKNSIKTPTFLVKLNQICLKAAATPCDYTVENVVSVRTAD
jgi:hypothetical protein